MRYIVKRPAEADDYVFDFRRRARIADGDTLTGSATITSTRISGTGTLTIGTGSVSSPRVTVRISGGDDGDVYRIQCSIGTTGGATLVSEMPFKISTTPDGSPE